MQLRRVDLVHASPAQIAFYKAFVVPEGRLAFQRRDKYPLAIGVEAVIDGDVVGFAFAVCEIDIRQGRLSSLFVKEGKRGKKIGSQLVAYVEEELIKAGCIAICTEYADDNPTRTPFEKILQKDGWNPPGIYMISCTYNVQDFHPPWFEKNYPSLPKAFQEFMWKDLKPEEKARLAYLAEQWAFSPDVSPFREEQMIEYQNSLGLRHEGQVVGWMITHRVDPNTIAYSSLYTHKEYRQAGYGIRLLIDSIRLQQQSPVPYSLFKVNFEQVDPAWFHFVKRRLLPYAQKVQRIYWSWHQIERESVS